MTQIQHNCRCHGRIIELRTDCKRGYKYSDTIHYTIKKTVDEFS